MFLEDLLDFLVFLYFSCVILENSVRFKVVIVALILALLSLLSLLPHPVLLAGVFVVPSTFLCWEPGHRSSKFQVIPTGGFHRHKP